MSNSRNNRTTTICLIIITGLLLTACGNANGSNMESNTNSNNSAIVEPNAPQVPNEESVADEQSSDTTNNSDVPVLEEESSEALKTTESMVEAMLEKVEQPALMNIPLEMVSDLYHLDPSMLEQFTIKMPMMNVKTNEIAILQVKDANDIPAIEEAVKQRATDIQKQFETYLQDQYENAKNYKLVIKENYVLFVISEEADSLVNEFNSFFE